MGVRTASQIKASPIEAPSHPSPDGGIAIDQGVLRQTDKMKNESSIKSERENAFMQYDSEDQLRPLKDGYGLIDQHNFWNIEKPEEADGKSCGLGKHGSADRHSYEHDIEKIVDRLRADALYRRKAGRQRRPGGVKKPAQAQYDQKQDG